MAPYSYTPLSPAHSSIRLLRLLPHQDERAEIQCEVFEYAVQNFHDTHLYEALSYVWGDLKETAPVSIAGCSMNVTINLHAALLRLRNHSFARILWIDAICINQHDQQEKEIQIRLMATIYQRAIRVVVWLGEASDNSDLALHAIRSAGSKRSAIVAQEGVLESAGHSLFQRPWFRRIWVLQEVAAARNVLFMCGSDKIDGYAFALGVELWQIFLDLQQDLQDLILSVTCLIKEAIFRPYNPSHAPGESFLGIRSLGRLLDMYHAHNATKQHDKVYALLGMSSDDLSKADLYPNYAMPWEQVIQRLLRHVISENVTAKVVEDRQAVAIRTKGQVFGTVVSTEKDPTRGDRRCLHITHAGKVSGVEKRSWTVQTTAKPVQAGDIICILQGSSQKTIVRAHNDHFAIIVIAVEVLEEVPEWPEFGKTPSGTKSAEREFLLVWEWEAAEDTTGDWNDDAFWAQSSTDKVDVLEARPETERSMTKVKGASKESRTMATFNNWPTASDLEMDNYPKSEAEMLKRVTRSWNVILILGDVMPIRSFAHDKWKHLLEAWGRIAISNCETVIGRIASDTTEGLLTWKQHCKSKILDLLVTDSSLEIKTDIFNSKPMPLLWAVEGEHQGVVELLVHSMQQVPTTLLFDAAKGGCTILVQALMESGKIDVNKKGWYGRTLLSEAATYGHESLVELLLGINELEVDTKDMYGKTPFMEAVKLGHEDVARLLIDTGKVDLNAKDSNQNTALLLAVKYGQEEVVQLLLETGEVDVHVEGEGGDTPLTRAVMLGHDEIVGLLLETEKIVLYADDMHGDTHLSRALKVLEEGGPPSEMELFNWNRYGTPWKKEGWHERYECILELLRGACKIESEDDKAPWHVRGDEIQAVSPGADAQDCIAQAAD